MKKYLLLVLIIAIAATAHGQTGATLSGRVTDQRDASIAGAEVRLTTRAGTNSTTSTDANGDFVFSNIAPGDYILEVKAPGFASQATAIKVTHGQSLTQNLRLPIEAVNEIVVVTPNGTPQQIDETSKAITVLDAQTIEAKRETGLS
ncbi:MAG TPA: carboxypeptidase-like regulatory domain-containing protein, partial [Pyrinomonadaceae bacterium]